MGESAEMSVYLELLRLGVMALHGETLGQRATIQGAVREAVGRSALISAPLTPLCSPQVLACLLSCMCANVWHVSGVLMRWIWLVASTDAMDALGRSCARGRLPTSCPYPAALRGRSTRLQYPAGAPGTAAPAARPLQPPTAAATSALLARRAHVVAAAIERPT